MTMLLMLAALTASTASAQPAGEPQTMVVTGQRMTDLRARLDACLRRACPPNEDVDASLALAEAEFLNGDYERADRWIEASIGRNRRHGRAYPEPVADLYRSRARVMSHMGRDQTALYSSRETLRTLRLGLPVEDHRHLVARLEIAQMLLQTGDRVAAQNRLREVATLAERLGRDDIARFTRMRLLQLAYTAAPHGANERQLLQLANSADPEKRFESVMARLILARQYRSNGDEARADAMLAGIPPSDGETRSLRYSPPLELISAQARNGVTADNFEDKWIDVAHWIRPDGTVESVEIVRRGGTADWAEPLLASIRGRIYESSTDQAPSYRLERYTYTAGLGIGTGSRIVARIGAPRIEYLDLTARDEPGRETPTAVTPQRQND